MLSGLAYPASIPGKILDDWRQGSIEVWVSTYILDEVRRVLPRLAHRLAFPLRPPESVYQICRKHTFGASETSPVDAIDNPVPFPEKE